MEWRECHVAIVCLGSIVCVRVLSNNGGNACQKTPNMLNDSETDSRASPCRYQLGGLDIWKFWGLGVYKRQCAWHFIRQSDFFYNFQLFAGWDTDDSHISTMRRKQRWKWCCSRALCVCTFGAQAPMWKLQCLFSALHAWSRFGVVRSSPSLLFMHFSACFYDVNRA